MAKAIFLWFLQSTFLLDSGVHHLPTKANIDLVWLLSLPQRWQLIVGVGASDRQKDCRVTARPFIRRARWVGEQFGCDHQPNVQQ